MVNIAQAAPDTGGLTLRCSTNPVGQYQKIEFTLAGIQGNYTNPCDSEEVEVNLSLTAPSGTALIVPAFYCQDYERCEVGQKAWIYPAGMPVWKARFSPGELGNYEARASVKDYRGVFSSSSVSFQCVPSNNRGFLRISRRDPRFLEFADGQPFFPIGQNLAFIGSQQYVTLPRAEGIFSKLAANGANYLRLWACCDDWAMAVEARKSAWGRSWDWHPPMVSVPGEETTNRKCLKLAGESRSLKLEPSHPVALRPGTRYAFSGRVRIGGAARLQLAGGLLGGERSLIFGPTGWQTFHCEFSTRPGDFWLGEMSLRLEGEGAAWVSDLSLREVGGGPELLWEADVNRPSRGFYNPLDCFILDELLAAAEQRGLYLQLCLLTRDLYMSALKDPAAPAYDQAVRDAKKLFRYAVARWGYSTSVAAWEYWNEMDPGLPTDRFYLEHEQLLLQAPDFLRDIACEIGPLNPATN